MEIPNQYPPTFAPRPIAGAPPPAPEPSKAPGDRLITLLGIGTLVYGITVIVHPALFLIFSIMRVLLSSSRFSRQFEGQIGNITEIVNLAAAAGLIWGGSLFSRNRSDSSQWILWGSCGVIAGIILRKGLYYYFLFSGSYGGEIPTLSAVVILNLAADVLSSIMIPLFLVLLVRTQSFREYFSSDASEHLAESFASGTESQSGADVLPCRPPETHALSYFQGVHGIPSAIVAPTLALAGRCTVLLGGCFLINFLTSRHMGEQFTIAQDLFSSRQDAFVTIFDLVRCPLALLMIFGGFGTAKLRAGVRRWMMAAGWIMLVRELGIWLFLERNYIHSFDLSRIMRFLQDIISLGQNALFPLFMILAFRQKIAGSVLPDRADGRHWWETELSSEPQAEDRPGEA